MQMPDNEPKGGYPGVFDYRSQKIDDDEGITHYWAFLLWDLLIVTVIFDDPNSVRRAA